MERYFVIRDGQVIASLETREEAIEVIERKKKRDTYHPLLTSEYWIIKGTEEFLKI